MVLLSFVIPCYRSEKTIEKVYQEIRETVAERQDYDYEIIAVNDCSPDNVLAVLTKIAAEDEKFKVIDLAKNFGKHSAVMAGYGFVTGDLVVNLDDDYQCPVNELWRLVDPLIDEGYDCATALYKEKKESLWKRIGSIVNTVMVQTMLEHPKGLKFDNFYAFKGFICDEILRYHNPYPFVSGLILRATNKIIMVPMEDRDRADGNSTGFTLKKSLDLFLNGLTSFSVTPLRMATVIGFFMAAVGFFFVTFVIVKKILNPMVTMGYSSLMAVILFSAGMIMVMLGIIGEYIGRIFISINNSPQYVIRGMINIQRAKTRKIE